MLSPFELKGRVIVLVGGVVSQIPEVMELLSISSSLRPQVPSLSNCHALKTKLKEQDLLCKLPVLSEKEISISTSS